MMKKVMLVPVAMGMLLLGGLVSCSKDYTCTCEYYTDGTLMNTDNTKISEGSKDDSAAKCDEMDNHYTTTVGGTTTHTETKCSLK